jgi:hypothetical protein
MTESPVVYNVLLAARALAGALLYAFTTVLLGDMLLRRLRAVGGPFHIELAAVAGMAVYSAAFTMLALAGAAHPVVVLAVVAIPVLLGWPHAPEIWRALTVSGKWVPPRAGPVGWWAVVILTYVAYAGMMVVTNPLGGDLGNYHLIVPRDVLWNHSFVFNRFSHDAGIPYGWHLYGLPAFLIGGDRGYVALSLVAFALLLRFVWIVGRMWRDDVFGAAAAAITAFTLCGLARSNVANNDVPTILVEATALLLAVYRLPIPPASQAGLFGLLCGFGLAMKLQLAASAMILPVLFIARIARGDWRLIATAAAVGLPLAVIWPTVTFANTGSPLPQVMMALRTEGPPPAHMREAMAVLEAGFGQWYQHNVERFFLHGMEGFTLLLAGAPAALLLRATGPVARLPHLLVAFALGRWLLLAASTQRADIVWHDRYHLISFVALGIAGLCSWDRLIRPERAGLWPPGATPVVLVVSIAVAWQCIARYDMRTPDPLRPSGERYERRGSLLDEMRAKVRTFQEPPGAGPNGGLYDWMAEHLPRDAKVATTVIDPYHIQRQAIQLLPVSQDEIDLSQPPDALLLALRELGVTHLHLTQFSGLNPWMNPEIDRWLAGVRRIPMLPCVELLQRSDARSDKGEQAVYRLVSADAGGPAAACQGYER